MSLRDAIVVSVPGKAKLSAPFDFQGLWDRPLVFGYVGGVLCKWCRAGDADDIVGIEEKIELKDRGNGDDD